MRKVSVAALWACTIGVWLACSDPKSIGECPRGSEERFSDAIGIGEPCYAGVPTTSCQSETSCTTCVYGQLCPGGGTAGDKYVSCQCGGDGKWQCTTQSQNASSCGPEPEAGTREAAADAREAAATETRADDAAVPEGGADDGAATETGAE